jgi:hypothetical protein
MLQTLPTPILTALAGIALSGCLSDVNKLSMLPEPTGNKPFLVGWEMRTSDTSAKDAHKKLYRRYNKAVDVAAAKIGWTLEQRVLANASNLSTTSDPERFRSASSYSINAPDLGCEITVSADDRVTPNCIVSVNVGGLISAETPEGVKMITADAWAFDQSMAHFIRLQSSDNRQLPVAEFSKLVSANLPASIFLYKPNDDKTWLNNGNVVVP